MAKLTPDRVKILVDRFKNRVAKSPVDTGESIEVYLTEIFESPEYYEFVQMLGRIPGAYEDNLKDILKKVIPDAFTMSNDWIWG